MLNKKQIVVLIFGIALLILAELFPPWLYAFGNSDTELSWGYHYFLTRNFPDLEGVIYYRINWNRMLLQYYFLFCGAVGLFLAVKDTKKKWHHIGILLFSFCAGLVFIGWLQDVYRGGL